MFSLIKVVVTVTVIGLTYAQPLMVERCIPYNTRHCYSLYGSSTTDFTWYQAENFCRNISQHLVSIPDKQTEDLLVSMIRDAPNPITNAWTIGQASNDTTWRTIEGDIYTGYVSASRDVEACGGMSLRTTGTRERILVTTGQYCYYTRHPLCQVPRDGFCLYNEIAIPPYCYRLLDNAASWFEAEVKCEEYAPGAHLAYTHISDKTFLETIMLDQAVSIGEPIWVGIYMRPWFWRFNDCYMEKRNMLYSNWGYVSHPPLSGTPEALAIDNDGKWRDYILTTKLDYFFCEKDELDHGHDYGSYCPPVEPEELPTIPLRFTTTTTTTATMTPSNETATDDGKARDFSTAALVLAVMSALVAIICVIAVCRAVPLFKKAIAKANFQKTSTNGKSAYRY